MITVIANNDFYETIIKRYSVNGFKDARNLFVEDWMNGVIGWNNFEYYGEGCDVENPAFTPEFLKIYGFEDEPVPDFIEGVCIYDWFCATGIHGSDEHWVKAYFVKSKE